MTENVYCNQKNKRRVTLVETIQGQASMLFNFILINKFIEAYNKVYVQLFSSLCPATDVAIRLKISHSFRSILPCNVNSEFKPGYANIMTTMTKPLSCQSWPQTFFSIRGRFSSLISTWTSYKIVQVKDPQARPCSSTTWIVYISLKTLTTVCTCMNWSKWRLHCRYAFMG